MPTKQNIIIGAAAVVIVILVGYLLINNQSSVTTSAPQGTKTTQGIVAAPNTSPISQTGQVVTPTGQAVKLNVTPGTPEAPQQSNPIASPKDIPSQAIKLSVSAAGFSPSSFTVNSGAAVTVALTSTDTQTHGLMFDDASLSAVAIGVGPGETRAITFNAPKAGTYTFYCYIPGHRARGEIGKMIVK